MTPLEFSNSGCATKGVLLDTNIFMLLVIGTVDPERVKDHKKTQKFDADDYRTLIRFLSFFKIIQVTPCVITEACNLLDTVNRNSNYVFYATVRNLLVTLSERRVESSVLAKEEAFLRLGLADVSIISGAKKGKLVLTDDLDLVTQLYVQKLKVMNFSHLQQATWATA
jgi:hypothetical protein